MDSFKQEAVAALQMQMGAGFAFCCTLHPRTASLGGQGSVFVEHKDTEQGAGIQQMIKQAFRISGGRLADT